MIWFSAASHSRFPERLNYCCHSRRTVARGGRHSEPFRSWLLLLGGYASSSEAQPQKDFEGTTPSSRNSAQSHFLDPYTSELNQEGSQRLDNPLVRCAIARGDAVAVLYVTQVVAE